MPNWVINFVELVGEEQRINELKEAIKSSIKAKNSKIKRTHVPFDLAVFIYAVIISFLYLSR